MPLGLRTWIFNYVLVCFGTGSTVTCLLLGAGFFFFARRCLSVRPQPVSGVLPPWPAWVLFMYVLKYVSYYCVFLFPCPLTDPPVITVHRFVKESVPGRGRKQAERQELIITICAISPAFLSLFFFLLLFLSFPSLQFLRVNLRHQDQAEPPTGATGDFEMQPSILDTTLCMYLSMYVCMYARL